MNNLFMILALTPYQQAYELAEKGEAPLIVVLSEDW